MPPYILHHLDHHLHNHLYLHNNDDVVQCGSDQYRSVFNNLVDLVVNIPEYIPKLLEYNIIGRLLSGLRSNYFSSRFEMFCKHKLHGLLKLSSIPICATQMIQYRIIDLFLLMFDDIDLITEHYIIVIMLQLLKYIENESDLVIIFNITTNVFKNID